MFKIRPINLLVSLAIASGSLQASASTSLSDQVAMIPDEFKTHFYNVPLSAKVTLNGRVLGDAMLILTEDNRVSLIEFTDHSESEYSDRERQEWLKSLAGPFPLGVCSGECPSGLMALHYNLSDSSLAVITSDDAQSDEHWYARPENGNSGLMLNNQLNLSGGKEQTSMSWNAGLEAAVHSWTVTSQFQYDSTRYQSGETVSRHAMTSLYAQQDYQQHFFRTGIFTPDSQGLLRQPYLANGGISTMAGVMAGSSDALLKDGGKPAIYPIYVTANREGVAEVYRDGSLLYTQPLEPGLQLLNTTSLPSGIYDVDIRVMEEGREASRTTETVNKPSLWTTPGQRMRYNLFAGRLYSPWNSYGGYDDDQEFAIGSSLNYLLLPQLTTGLALQKVGDEKQAGISMDWQVSAPLQLYGNIWNSNVTGTGFDSQAMWIHKQGNVALNHSRSWYRTDETSTSDRPSIAHNTTLSSTWRLSSVNSLNGRLNYNSRMKGAGVDIGLNTRTTIGETPVSWRIAGFDRPYSQSSNIRNRGVSVNASFPLSGNRRSGNLSVGSRTDSSGSRDLYTSATVNQQWAETNPISATSVTLTGDRHGAGISTYNQFDTVMANGTFWGQRSTEGGKLSGGLNMSNLLALGKDGAVLSRQTTYGNASGMIIDVVSDDDALQLQALSNSGSFPLKSGRNFIPVEAWKPGSLQVDAVGVHAPAMKIEPEYLSYHQIPGEVSSHQVRVMKTVSVMGRLVDANQQPLNGAKVVNHAGRTLSQADGIFTLEMHKNNPEIKIEHPSGVGCTLRLAPEDLEEQEIVFMGNLVCDEA
ncbi:CS1-pili formation C-terminal domain-containing protein [Enterobacteriaceae bacterium C23F]